MSDLIPKKKTLNLAILAALLSAILYFVGLFVVYKKIERVENLYFDAESEASREKRFLTIKSINESNKEEIQKLRDFFIKRGDEVVFIEQIENIAKNSLADFEINSIDIKPNQTDPFKEDVEIRMRIEGSWFNVTSFIDKLEKMPFGVLIEELDLDSDEPGVWVGFIELTVFREK